MKDFKVKNYLRYVIKTKLPLLGYKEFERTMCLGFLIGFNRKPRFFVEIDKTGNLRFSKTVFAVFCIIAFNIYGGSTTSLRNHIMRHGIIIDGPSTGESSSNSNPPPEKKLKPWTFIYKRRALKKL